MTQDTLILHLAGWLKISRCMRQGKLHFVLEKIVEGSVEAL
jgi:hypothetical protein